MNQITSFFAKVRKAFFIGRIEREIYNRISPHLEKEKDCGYPFTTDADMNALTHGQDLHACLRRIENHALQIPRAYGESFRYIFHRDLAACLKQYEELARRRVYPKTCNPCFVATRA